MRVAITALALLLMLAGRVGAQSLEEETRRSPGTSSLQDGSDRLRGSGPDEPVTGSLDDDSMELRGRTPDQDPTNSLDDGSLDGGDRADPDAQ